MKLVGIGLSTYKLFHYDNNRRPLGTLLGIYKNSKNGYTVKFMSDYTDVPAWGFTKSFESTGAIMVPIRCDAMLSPLYKLIVGINL